MSDRSKGAKCVRLGNEVRRVSFMEAQTMVQRGWKYCTKSEWRRYASSKISK